MSSCLRREDHPVSSLEEHCSGCFLLVTCVNFRQAVSGESPSLATISVEELVFFFLLVQTLVLFENSFQKFELGSYALQLLGLEEDASLQDSVARVCEAWWAHNLPGRERIVSFPSLS
jgi:hypothetical protein